MQSSIRLGLVSVNGRVIDKVCLTIRFFNFEFISFSTKFLSLSLSLFQVSHNVKAGDEVNCTISELQPLKAEPEDIPLDIVYEDNHVLVVNKP